MMLFRAFIILLVFYATLSLATPEDRKKSISVDADYAARNEITGETEYRGNVIIRQGSILIDAANVIIYYQNETVSRIVCRGSPATYQQQSSNGDGLVIARAEKIEYHLSEETISLKSDASLMRNGTYIKGDSIVYDLAQGTWRAKGDTEGEQKRIQLVIPPLTHNTVNKSKKILEQNQSKSVEKIL
jgi:lipopolysaccharide export system protein LptA